MDWLKEFEILAEKAEVNNPLFLAFACEAISRLKNQDEVNNKLREALQALFDECVIADMLGELSEAFTGETLDKVREALEAAKQSMHTDEGKAEAQEAKPNQLDTGLNW